MIYFIQQGYSGPVKIGYTDSDPQSRKSQLQVGNPKHLILVATKDGSLEDEKRLHLQFELFRVNGEWFSNSETLQTYIRENAQYSSEYVAYIRLYLDKAVKNSRKYKRDAEINKNKLTQMGECFTSCDNIEIFQRCQLGYQNYNVSAEYHESIFVPERLGSWSIEHIDIADVYFAFHDDGRMAHALAGNEKVYQFPYILKNKIEGVGDIPDFTDEDCEKWISKIGKHCGEKIDFYDILKDKDGNYGVIATIPKICHYGDSTLTNYTNQFFSLGDEKDKESFPDILRKKLTDAGLQPDF
jgi:hypothetical protein